MNARRYSLDSEFLDPSLERALLAALAREPSRYRDLVAELPDDAFAVEHDARSALQQAIDAGESASVPSEWEPASDPEQAISRLRDLHGRRLAAALIERLLDRLHAKEPSSPGTLLREFAREADAVVRRTREAASATLVWAEELVGALLEDAREAARRREETGDALVGLRSGLHAVDEVLGGLRTGQVVLAGAPGVGKTTLACQIAMHVAATQGPVIYVTYENTPGHLLLRVLCASAGIRTVDVERGTADLSLLAAEATRLRPALGRLALIGGHSQMGVAQVRAMIVRAFERCASERGLVIFDYLQRAAHGQGYEQLRHNVSALAGELRDLANDTGTCVLCLSSQNRAAGDYGDGPGSASLASLKESGDLEYGADVVLFLVKGARPADPPGAAVDLVVSKNRFGESGMRIPLVFRPDRGDLRERARGAHDGR